MVKIHIRKWRIVSKKDSKKIQTICNYRKNGDWLIVNCLECNGKQDLTDDRCRIGIIKILAREPTINGVVLSSLWEVSYAGECISILRNIAEIYGLCQELSRKAPSFPQCKDCPFEPALFYDKIGQNLPYLPDRKRLDEMIFSIPRYKSACEECVKGAESNIIDLRKRLDRIRMRIARKAFRVIERETKDSNQILE